MSDYDRGEYSNHRRHLEPIVLHLYPLHLNPFKEAPMCLIVPQSSSTRHWPGIVLPSLSSHASPPG